MKASAWTVPAMLIALSTTLVLSAVLLLTTPAGSALAEPPVWKLAVDLDDGSRIVGEPTSTSIRFRTADGERVIPLRFLVSARLEGGTWIAYIEEGEALELTGKILTQTLGLKTLFGPVDLPLRHAVALETFPTELGVTVPGREELVLYLNFDRPSGMRTRNLASFRHHAIVQGARWIRDGKRGGAYEFAGNATLEIPHHAELCPKAFTLSAWIYPEDAAGPWRLVVSKTNVSSWYGGYGFYRYSGDSRNLYFYAGNYYNAAANAETPQGKWVHVAGVCDGKRVQLYVNGEPSPPVELPDAGVIHDTTTPFLIGGGGGYNWVGKVDEVMLFRRALSAEEIEQLMMALSPRG